jgi:hypothetical protein
MNEYSGDEDNDEHGYDNNNIYNDDDKNDEQFEPEKKRKSKK